ncbi:hypothetical protein EVC45_02395 [Paraburkholderia sp. UYCP14C]|uniref:hypothetical protein n=1 Tax=Paraburkholderia sp. UYCP14C TaxID=2511130 RepID=UPI00102079FE|nr:hypothetical protein [Paraburkholderia sp. UYCP14C]RZF31322.1 hypothetical protein EVC45_02395 [Paraburkholderia sp. UYCP14C]
MKVSRQSAEKLLFANLYRALCFEKSAARVKPDFEETKLVSTTLRDDVGRMRLFSGTFVTPDGTAIMPFALSFSGRGDMDTSLGQLATYGYVKHQRSHILGFLAIISFLIETGEINVRLERLTSRFTNKGKYDNRVEFVAEWPEFRAASLKLLSYDTEQEFKRTELVAA